MEYYKNLSLEDLFYINDDGLVCCEEWRYIPNYEGRYQASSLGRLKSLIKHNGTDERILTQCISGRYYQVNLHLNGKMKTVEVHQLIAITFLNHIPCGMNLVVDHIDTTNKFNNCLSNLQIVPNRVNTNKKHLKSSSKYVGTSWCKTNKKWIAYININGKRISLGNFIIEDDAGMSYKIALENIDKFNGNNKEFRELTQKLL